PDTSGAEVGTAESLPAQNAQAPRKAKARLSWPVLCLFQLGLILGLASIWWQMQSGPHAPQEPAPQGERIDALPLAKSERPAAVLGAESLARAETLLREGRYEEALGIYHPPSETESPQLPPALRYRTGLCLEGLGRWEAALTAYRTVGGLQEDSVLSAA